MPGLLITVGLCLGIRYLDITTDPVELWASPASRARVEKEYYDDKFTPFYRTEMIIITRNTENFPWEPIKHVTSDGEETFGPVFEKEFMYKLLELQNKIAYEVNYFETIDADAVKLYMI